MNYLKLAHRCHLIRIGALAVLVAIFSILSACSSKPPPEPPKVDLPKRPPAPTEIRRYPVNLPKKNIVIVDAREYPWSAFGKLNAAGQASCTAIMIGPQHVLTRAQCLYNRRLNSWWPLDHVTYVGAYQSNDYSIKSKGRDRAVSSAYAPGRAGSLADLTEGWAVLRLRQPLGRQTGWLGLAWNDDGFQEDLLDGRSGVVVAGYSRAVPHVITTDLRCTQTDGVCKIDRRHQGMISVSFGPDGFAGFPITLRLRGVSADDRVLRFDEGLRAAGLELDTAVGASRAGGRPPLKSCTEILRYLGYLPPSGLPSRRLLAESIRLFERDNGHPETGLASAKLLGQLFVALRRVMDSVS